MPLLDRGRSGDQVEAPVGTISAGVKDVRAGLRRWPVWWTLSWQGFRSQYRRTYLGPWWVTLQQVIFVAGLSLLFGILLGQDLATFVPYVATGFICFNWMVGMIQGGATSMVDGASVLKTSPGPLSMPALKSFAGQTIQFLHDALVLVLVIIVFQVQLGPSIVVLPLAAAVIALNGIAVGLWLGPLVARYRDVGQIVNSLTRILFFFTPIFWTTTELSRAQITALAGWNPVAYLLEFIRSPLLGQWPTATVWVGVAVVSVTNLAIGILYFSRTRDRVVYWL